MNSRAKIAVFISGGGTNLQSLIDATNSGKLSGEIVLVVSSKSNAYGLERARNAGIDTFVFRKKDYPGSEEAEKDLLEMLEEYEVEYIALAGYLKLVPSPVVRRYKDRITNIHPALLPRYGGKGMYGHHVHEAVLASGDKESGATVHLVDEIYDHGEIIIQERIPVMAGDTPDTLAARVLEVEHKIYPQALENLIQGRYAKDE
ncbi:MAG: phosphoribosylglycinamide formyltransferase [Candidatus Zixiibacteriota bacterium]|nr:MAG: phosphoribosylglycinamide formyltransferase [candidate division Zixibacteria bacterium]